MTRRCENGSSHPRVKPSPVKTTRSSVWSTFPPICGISGDRYGVAVVASAMAQWLLRTTSVRKNNNNQQQRRQQLLSSNSVSFIKISLAADSYGTDLLPSTADQSWLAGRTASTLADICQLTCRHIDTRHSSWQHAAATEASPHDMFSFNFFSSIVFRNNNNNK